MPKNSKTEYDSKPTSNESCYDREAENRKVAEYLKPKKRSK